MMSIPNNVQARRQSGDYRMGDIGECSPLVSICLPTLNARQFLEERMSSITSQTLHDWELVVCDSNSTDGTWEFLQAFKDDPRVRLHQVPKEGLYAGWNDCIRRSRGEFIYFATADDTMERDCLQCLSGSMREHPDVDIALSEVLRIDENGRRLQTKRPEIWTLLDPSAQRCERVPGSSFFLLLCGLASGFGSITGLMVKRRLFEKTGMFPTDLWFLGDCEWALKAVLHSDVLVLPGILATWRRHGDQASAAWNANAARIFLRALERVLDDNQSQIPPRWMRTPSWRDRLLRARRADAELATKLVISNLRRHWRRFPTWILEAASAAPDMLLKRVASGFVLSKRLRADAVVETRKLLADFGECWPLSRQFFPHPSGSSAIEAGLAWQAQS